MIAGIDASRTVSNRRTGTEAYAWQLINALIHHTAQSGWQLKLYFNQPPSPTLFPQAEHVTHVVIPFPRLWTHLRLGWVLRRQPPSLFFTPSHVIPIGYKGETVATVHDLGYAFFPEAHTAWQRAYLNWSTRHNARLSHTVIAVSQATKDDLVGLYGVTAGKIQVVHSGLNVSSPAQNLPTDEILARYGAKPPYLLYVGTIQPRKNLERLVEAYALLSPPRPQLLLAGKKGWYVQQILQQIERLSSDVRAGIHLPGFVAEADKPTLIAHASALLYPSLYEGFGFPVLEGQACGTPVLTADNSSLPEIAGDGALLVDAEDVQAINAGIHQLLTDTSLRQKLITNGYANITRFRWEQTAARVWQILQQVAET